ncbi:MAG: Cof-type HAD-IIB family hydrolase [Streptococcaceae bacterium]|jgi:Cof subfamily protein (haloacid dehalogenase superfamily)|nr:Cof-type HAD-IIB family hydrolase [Streptococcaceae bacterium]
MSNIKLIALDLDGTLLSSNKQISDANIKVIQSARAKGIKVVFNTGRPLVSLLEYLSKLELYGNEEFTIANNGGLVQRNDGTIISQTLLSFEELAKIKGVAQSFELPIDIISGEICYTVESTNKSLLTYVNNTLEFRRLEFSEVPKEADFNKVIISAESHIIDELPSKFEAEFAQSYDYFRTRDILLEFMPKGVNKASGLEKLCLELGIKAEQVLAMGDEDNDAPMLEWAGLGIAPANAKGQALTSANIISEYTNDADAVAHVINQYVIE